VASRRSTRLAAANFADFRGQGPGAAQCPSLPDQSALRSVGNGNALAQYESEGRSLAVPRGSLPGGNWRGPCRSPRGFFHLMNVSRPGRQKVFRLDRFKDRDEDRRKGQQEDRNQPYPNDNGQVVALHLSFQWVEVERGAKKSSRALNHAFKADCRRAIYRFVYSGHRPPACCTTAGLVRCAIGMVGAAVSRKCHREAFSCAEVNRQCDRPD
jgi:hypothetical protein